MRGFIAPMTTMDIASGLGSTVLGGQIFLIVHQRASLCVPLKPTFMILGIRVCGLGAIAGHFRIKVLTTIAVAALRKSVNLVSGIDFTWAKRLD